MTAAERDVLSAIHRAGRGISRYKIELVTSLPKAVLQAALDGLIAGGFVSTGQGQNGHLVFTEIRRESPVHRSGSGQIAGRITIPQYRWGSGRYG